MRVLLLCLLCASLPLMAATREHAEVNGRKIWFSKPRDAKVLAAVIWLGHRDGSAKGDYQWWRSSGLVDRGVMLICPPPQRRRWDNFEDRPYLTHLKHWAERHHTVPEGRTLLVGHGDGAELAQRLAMSLPKHFLGCVLARGMLTSRLPGLPPDHKRHFGIFANANDPAVPLASMKRAAKLLPAKDYQLHWQVGMHGKELGPELWTVTEAVFTAASVTLRPASVLPDADTDAPEDSDKKAGAQSDQPSNTDDE